MLVSSWHRDENRCQVAIGCGGRGREEGLGDDGDEDYRIPSKEWDHVEMEMEMLAKDGVSVKRRSGGMREALVG